jgi:hypothetical protein
MSTFQNLKVENSTGNTIFGDHAVVQTNHQHAANVTRAAEKLEREVDESLREAGADDPVLRAAASVIRVEGAKHEDLRDKSALARAFSSIESGAKSVPMVLSAALTAKQLFGL